MKRNLDSIIFKVKEMKDGQWSASYDELKLYCSALHKDELINLVKLHVENHFNDNKNRILRFQNGNKQAESSKTDLVLQLLADILSN